MHRLHRRDFLYGMGASLGTVAFNALLQAEDSSRPKPQNLLTSPPLAPRNPHHKARAKACIFLFMEGGPSHLDTFDHKPALEKLHLKEFVREDKQVSAMASGKRYYIKSPFRHRQAGESGISLCEHFSHLSEVVDELCVYHGLQAESINHPTACYHMNTGNRFGGDPAIGSWMTYGLGTENQNLPAFIVLPEVAYPQGGAANWSNGFLPAYFQGTALRSTGSPILDLNPPPNVSRTTQRKNLDLLAALNRMDQQRHPHEEVLAARMESYELAFRMQTQVPDIINLETETRQTQEMYGLGETATDSFGRRCLLARKLIEEGVRFVQIYAAGWDSHDFLERSHQAHIQAVDKPIAGLLKDLKDRGLLNDTLVVWTGEFGRSPDNGIRSGRQAAGRDHNAKGMAMWMAGGGVKAGYRIGATDEIGDHAVENVNPIRNLHVTLEHIMGLDDNQLTYFHEGRFKVLSQTGGAVIKELLS